MNKNPMSTVPDMSPVEKRDCLFEIKLFEIKSMAPAQMLVRGFYLPPLPPSLKMAFQLAFYGGKNPGFFDLILEELANE